ncbi:MAG: acyl-[ACP]--phospholipid O-acyltransferase [Pirellulales bacterium]
MSAAIPSSEQSVPLGAGQSDHSRRLFNRKLMSGSFLGLLVTQLLGALNDNVFRWLVVPIAKQMFIPMVGDETRAESLALSVGLACLVAPYLLLAAPAGYLADRYSKRAVIVNCKIAEILLMLLGVGAIYLGNIYLLFTVVFLMGSQSALFGPSKLGCIPEMVRPDRISAANGLVGLTTVIAVVVGAVVGGYLYELTWSKEAGLQNLWPASAMLLGTALCGWLASLLIDPLPSGNAALRFPYNPLHKTWQDLRTLAVSRAMLRVAIGSAFFWSLASLAQMNVDTLVVRDFGWQQSQVGPLLAILSLGVGIGSVLAGVWSAGRVELGIVPLGAAGIAVSSMLLWLVDPAGVQLYPWGGLLLFMLGASAGLFDIPLTSYIQHRSSPEQRGSIIAASNFMTFAGMLLVSGLFYLLRDALHLSPQQIFLGAGLLTVPVFLYIVFLLPNATIRFVVWLATHTIYRLRFYGRENLPAEGGALLVANHVSWLDGIYLMLATSRPVRMVAFADNMEKPVIKQLAKLFGVIPIKPGRRSVVESLRVAREAIAAGELVCIFPEGEMTRSGQMHPFKPGLLRIVHGTDAPVIPIYLDELWGSIFSFQGGRFFWKRPQRWPYPVSIHFGQPVPQPLDVHRVRQTVEQLGAAAVVQRKDRKMILPRAFLRMCRRNLFREKIVDSTGAKLKGGGMLLKTLIFRRLLDRKLLAPDEKFVGLLLPPSVAAVLANAALPLCGRVGVNLNYTVSDNVLNACIGQCGIRHVLTSRKVMEKLDLKLNADLIYLEDLRDAVTTGDKLAAALQAYATPVVLLERQLGLTKVSPDDLLTIIFTSGSTGDPKGVMLTHYNVASNVEAINQVVHITRHDVAIGLLPFFHVFGYTALMWTVLALEPKGVYHFSPLDAHQVGKLCRQHGVTLLMATPTFLRNYLRRCDKEDFAKLEAAFAGAEKLPPDLIEAFEAKFGIRPMEAYGASELTALVSVNIPPNRARGLESLCCKEGTVGRPVPGVSARVVHPETGEELGVDQPGMLHIKGPNVMKGYYNKPELTAEVIKDGWYVTGDIASIDGDGFIRITGRVSRFSKIGGEMVPHILIEEKLQELLSPDAEELQAVVTAIPDGKRGERLVVLHLALDRPPAQLCKELAAAGLPNLFIPSPDSFVQVEQIPVLGTGKLDLRGLKDAALAHFGEKD